MTTTVFKDVRLFDGWTVTPCANVRVENGAISSVSAHPLEMPIEDEGAVVIDGSGKTLLPGLLDGHIHAHLPPGKGSEILKPAIACGITTCCDLHNKPETVRALKADCSASPSLPDLKSACYAATIEGGWPKPILLHLDPSEENKRSISQSPSVTVDTAEDFVRSNRAAGADYIKLMQEDGEQGGFKDVPQATLELQSAVTEAAHKYDLLVLAHANTLRATTTVLQAGCDGVAHSFRDQPPTPEIIGEFQNRNVFLIPTLAIACSGTAEEQELREYFATKATPDQLPEEDKTNLLTPLGISKSRGSVENAYLQVKELKAAGVDIVAGTDAVPQLRGTAIGISLIQELWQYVNRCGFSPVEALRSATSIAAKRFRFADRGTIARGLRADLLLVHGDPSSNIEDLLNVVGVWKAGALSYETELLPKST